MRDVSVNRFAVVSYAVPFGFGGIERDSHSPTATTSTIYGFQKREDCYEEGSFRGAFHSGANFRYPLVDMKRRARECSAFFYARRPIRGNSKGLWRFVGVATPRHSTLWFETKHRVPCRNATFRHGTPVPNAPKLSDSLVHRGPLVNRTFRQGGAVPNNSRTACVCYQYQRSTYWFRRAAIGREANVVAGTPVHRRCSVSTRDPDQMTDEQRFQEVAGLFDQSV